MSRQNSRKKQRGFESGFTEWCLRLKPSRRDFRIFMYSKTCVREPPSRLTLNSGWCGKSCLSYKGTCHVILLAKLHDMYLYKTTIFPHQPLRSISKVTVLHRFYCRFLLSLSLSLFYKSEGHMTLDRSPELKIAYGSDSVMD